MEVAALSSSNVHAGVVSEEELSMNCPLYRTENEFLCDCAWHVQYLGYNHAMKVMFATDRSVALQRILEKRAHVKELYEMHQHAVALQSAVVLRLQEELVCGTSDVWQVSSILKSETDKLDVATARFRELKERLNDEATRLLEVFYNVKL